MEQQLQVIQESPSPKRIDLPDMNEIQISSPKSKITQSDSELEM